MPLVPLSLLGLVVEPLVVPLQLGHRSSSLTSTLLYYISRSSGYRHRNPNINVREIIWLGNQLIPHQTHISILSSLSLDGFVFVWIFRWMDFQSFLHVSIGFGQSGGVATQRTDISILFHFLKMLQQVVEVQQSCFFAKIFEVKSGEKQLCRLLGRAAGRESWI